MRAQLLARHVAARRQERRRHVAQVAVDREHLAHALEHQRIVVVTADDRGVGDLRVVARALAASAPRRATSNCCGSPAWRAASASRGNTSASRWKSRRTTRWYSCSASAGSPCLRARSPRRMRAAAEVVLLAPRAAQVLERRRVILLGHRRLGQLAVVMRDRGRLLRHADRRAGARALRRPASSRAGSRRCARGASAPAPGSRPVSASSRNSFSARS